MTTVITVRVTKCAQCGCPFSAMSDDAIRSALFDHYAFLHRQLLG